MTGRISRRSLLGGALAAPALIRPAWGLGGLHLRVGAILPLAGPTLPDSPDNLSALAETARQGIVLGEEEMQRNAALFGHELSVFTANAPGAEAAARAARRLVAVDGVSVLIGGFTQAEAQAISAVAEETGALFLNIAASGLLLRTGCASQTFHVEASAAMYLDALAGWYVRAGHRRWYILHGAGDEDADRLDRAKEALGQRHWGAKIVGEAAVDRRSLGDAMRDIAKVRPDAVLLLNDWHGQLEILARYEAEGLAFPVAGFPEAATQTRRYYSDAMLAAPNAGAGHRAALWEATLDAYGARELNARAAARWGRPLDPTGWAAYQAVKIAFDAAQFGGTTEGPGLAAHLAGSGTVIDVHKGIGVSFRPWDHQLRQSLYLVRLNPLAGRERDVATLRARAHLLGELPAIYMPGTDPVERLDQLGDLTAYQGCRS